ncbi:MAG TPA: FAD-dependent oxidoreductase [Leptospiraceae bacterium]|nr:FAD-dependent oxidoreductase [Leptospiraceae bacterium]HMY67377.1 FAD-dependent oxidoreductase [Leptospiraceae bacterium]HNF15056.1 FAD-dependent oxidoreductase [Leptospiraceae bacterium]HNF23176.1 FAD-dependent oxidoreductase [Leptospiraceae bacterium]HNI25268.1 FAD-dependent oxidoreductase [Leptospiraceae bacterium]
MKKKIAVIGTGIAGMGAAYFLRNEFDMEIFEKNDYVGGHTNTVTVQENGKDVNIDTGFIVYNDVTYPNLIRLFSELNVPVKNSQMSFSVQYLPTGLEFCGSGIDGLFAQRKNFLNPSYYRLLYNINRFNNESVSLLDNPEHQDITLAEYIKIYRFHPDLLEYYLVPMSSAVWSTPVDKMMKFPAVTLIRFFKNHGFLGLNTQHQWKTVVNGSKSYMNILTFSFRDRIRTGKCAIKVSEKKDSVSVEFADGEKRDFDRVILACHADEALAMLESPTPLQKELLSNFKYEKNTAVLHTDETVMPKIRKAWSSWNYRVEKKGEGWSGSNIIYWMNSLQGVSDKMNYFVSINDTGNINPSKIIKKQEYYHPLFTVESMNAQKDLPKLNDSEKVNFCGSYFRYGFHEDAFSSGLNLAEKLLGRKVWN